MALPPYQEGYHENLRSGSKVISGTPPPPNKHTQKGDLISLLSFLESRLKTDADNKFCGK
jgi:hypothetical protein